MSETERPSVAQLRREAAKARALGDAAFGEEERRQLFEIAAALDREATSMEFVLSAAQRRMTARAESRRLSRHRPSTL